MTDALGAAPHESAPRCRVGIRTVNQCLRRATVGLRVGGPESANC